MVASRDADGGRAQKSKREGAYFFLVAIFFVAFFTVFFGVEEAPTSHSASDNTPPSVMPIRNPRVGPIGENSPTPAPAIAPIAIKNPPASGVRGAGERAMPVLCHVPVQDASVPS